MQVVLANGAELFPRVVCGVDGSAAGEEAVRQALLLSDPRGQLVLVSLVVGSRGLGGVRALGSVSERVAHRAPVSVLVVRSGEPGASRYAGTAD
jgi:nucleotide-binding universal stress UspA family protein